MIGLKFEKASKEFEKGIFTEFVKEPPHSDGTPTPILRYDLGSLSMEERVIQNKLNFVHHLVSQRDQEESESLAGEVFNLQAKYGFPGLVTECRKYIQTYKLPKI